MYELNPPWVSYFDYSTSHIYERPHRSYIPLFFRSFLMLVRLVALEAMISLIRTCFIFQNDFQ